VGKRKGILEKEGRGNAVNWMICSRNERAGAQTVPCLCTEKGFVAIDPVWMEE